MEKIYNVPRSELINIKKFYNEYTENLQLNDTLKLQSGNQNDIAKLLNFENENNSEFQELISSVSLEEHLSQDDDVKVFEFQPGLTNFKHKPIIEIPKRALNLNTFAKVIKFKKKYYGSPFGQSPLSYKSTNNLYLNRNINNLKPFSDVLISIRFYRPFRFVPGGKSYGPRFAEEFYVLGSQYLTELRDKISCICNEKRLIDISDNPHQEIPNITDTNPGFFFITNTFYNDTRNPENPDYSEVIRKWSQKRKDFENLSIDKTAKMEETKFFDLDINLGFPQVYQHHGNCEHLFTFSSIRLLSPDDNLNRKSYPLLTSLAFPNAKLCNICAGREHTYIVTNSQRQFHDPCYLCRLCFTSFYYIKGKKIGNFEAYKLKPNDKINEDINELSSDLEEDDNSDNNN